MKLFVELVSDILFYLLYIFCSYMRRIHCFTLSALLLSNGFVAMAKNGESVSRPNVIYILCDDLGYGELGYNGQNKIQTPELDNLESK